MKGYIYNNLGIVHFFSFIEKSTLITDTQKEQGGIEIIGKLVTHLEKGISNLKLSIQTFEQFDQKFDNLISESKDAEDEVTVGLIK